MFEVGASRAAHFRADILAEAMAEDDGKQTNRR